MTSLNVKKAVKDAKNKDDLSAAKQDQAVNGGSVKADSKLASAKRYAEAEYSIFPCKPDRKTPAISGWKELATTDIAVIEQWWSDNPDFNIGVLADSHIVLDVDVKPDRGVDGFTTLKKHPNLPETFTVNTPSGGKHFFFHADEPQALTICTGFEPGLDIRAGGKGYTIGAGSTINGVPYTVASADFDMAPAPDWVEAAARNKKQASFPLRVTRDQVSEVTLEKAEAALASIDPDCGYAKWIKVGMAIHSQFPDERGLSLWDRWSSEGDKFKPGECEKHWQGFKDAGGITIGTLFHFSNGTGGNGETPNQGNFFKGTNDTTIAEAFVSKHGSHVIFDADNKQWRVFSNGAWQSAEESQKTVIAYYKGIILELKEMVMKSDSFPAADNPWKWLNKAMNQSVINSVLKIVQVRLGHGIKSFDSNPGLIGMQDRVFEISQSNVRSAEAKDHVFKSVGTAFVSGAICPQWEAFLDVVMQGDAKMIAYLRRLVGYFMTASNREQQVFFLYGSGANGKSTFLDVVKALLGDYAVKIVSDAIMKSKMGERSNGSLANLANLAGARLAITDELNDSTAAFDVQTLKSISGDDEITARRLYHNPITFKSTAKIVMYGNDKPYGNINDEGFWRRLRFIHFGHVVPPEKRDPGLLDKLKGELPGILNWALQGLAEWTLGGLKTPQKVLDDSFDYRKELDTVTEFLGANVIVQASEQATTKHLLDEYEKWCERNLKTPESAQSFSRRAKQYLLTKKNVYPFKTSQSRGYKGIKLK